jgi:serine/threonine protein kinase
VIIREFLPGSLIANKYLVEAEIGEGGLGVVVRARHVQLEQLVAIKYLKPYSLTLPGIVERFVREARLAAKIKNEHAVKVQDVDTLENGIPYMVMEFLEGRDLGQVVSEGPLPLQQAIEYVLQASEALAEAHAMGIVHRDLKPDNLFLTQRPGGASMVKIFDFGISKASPVKKGSGRRERAITQVNDRFGTPGFMSPEQLQSSEVDARADIWALGVVLYELVTGKLPFEGEELVALFTAILTRPHVPIETRLPAAPKELRTIIDRCLEKDPANRYRNVAEFAQDLVQIWEDESPSRIKQITQVIREAGHSIRPPTFPGQIKVQPLVEVLAARGEWPPVGEAPKEVDASTLFETSAESIIGVFKDASDHVVDELHFASIPDAYDHAWSLGPDVIRCELYDEFAGVRGKHRVTYVRKGQTELWVPLMTVLAVLALLSSFALSCGGDLASQVAKAPEFQPKDQTQCSVVASHSKPLVVEWPSADRGQLEAQVRRGGLAVVEYSGCQMRVLDRCSGGGKYNYSPITKKTDHVAIRDTGDLYANVPVGAARLEAKLAKVGELNVEMTMVGRWETAAPSLRSDQLQGDCAGATHVISAVTVGAFTFSAGAEAEVGGGATVLGAGGGAKSTSKRETLSSDGKATACEKATLGDPTPPDECGALIRLEVVPLVPSNAFVGRWNCVSTVTATDGSTAAGATSHVITDNGDGTVTNVGTGSDGTTCSARFAVSDDTATLLGPATCQNAKAVATIQSARWSLVGGTLNATGVERVVVGGKAPLTMTVSGKCNRQ